MYSVVDREITSPALGSEAEGIDFWVLICEDEEWLRAEFDAIVSEPTETLRQVVDLTGIESATRPPWPGRQWRGMVRMWRVGDRPERHLSRERGPPSIRD